MFKLNLASIVFANLSLVNPKIAEILTLIKKLPATKNFNLTVLE